MTFDLCWSVPVELFYLCNRLVQVLAAERFYLVKAIALHQANIPSNKCF